MFRFIAILETTREISEVPRRVTYKRRKFVVLLLFLQKQNLANAISLFGLGTLLSGLGLKHMRIRSHHDLAGTLVTPYS